MTPTPAPLPASAAFAALLAEPAVARLLAVLNPPGEETRLVGGAVRNALLGLAQTDIDLATTLLPDTVMAAARAEGLKAVPTGYEHGTITVLVAGKPFEITTLREDIATDGRHAKVRFGRDFARDAHRRDFTLNALSLDAAGRLYDYTGGLADLHARKVRFIGLPATRLQEDYLRGLRFLRFSAQYSGALDPEGLAAIRAAKAGYAQLSRERVRQESLKLLVAPQAARVLAPAADILECLWGLPVDAAFFARRIALPEPTDALARLAAIIKLDTQTLAVLRESLRLTHAEYRALAALLAAEHAYTHPPAPLSGLDALLLHPQAASAGAEALIRLSLRTDTPALLAALPRLHAPPKFYPTGEDLLALGVPSGPRIGALLHAARHAWAQAGFAQEEAGQRALLAAILAQNLANPDSA